MNNKFTYEEYRLRTELYHTKWLETIRTILTRAWTLGSCVKQQCHVGLFIIGSHLAMAI